MKAEYIVPILIAVLQIGLILVIFDLKNAFKRMVNSIKYNIQGNEPDLTMRIVRILSNFRQADETKEAQHTSADSTANDVIKQVTQALEVISLDKTKDVKIIISNDNINQGRFVIKLSYRLDDPL